MTARPDFSQVSITLQAIGVVKNTFDEPTDPDELRGAESQIIIDQALAGGLDGLKDGQQIMVIFLFHKAPEDYDLHQHPRGDRSRPARGVFALRSPHRPNRVGVTVVDLLCVEGNVLHVHGLDALNGTPVLDVKPG